MELLTPETRQFIKEWENPSPFIEAHTSGSTGTPKAIRLLKADMLTSARATNARFGIDSASLLVCPLSAEYIAGKMMIVRALQAGCYLWMLTPSNRFTGQLSTLGAPITLLAVVPSQVPDLLAWDGLNRVQNVIIGGAPLAPQTEQSLVEAHVNAFATYGMTETCSHVALRPMGADIYQAMPGVNFGVDQRRCLRIQAPDFSFQALQTNDCVQLLSPSSFRWLGRADNVINSGGIKIHPEEVERLLAPLLSAPYFVIGIPDTKWGTALALVVESTPSASPLNFSTLPPYLRPKKVIYTPKLPRTPNGKILRRLPPH